MPEQYWWVWAILAAFFIIAEILTAGFFLLWFGVGAIVAGAVAYFGLGLFWQLAAFVGVSLLLFVWSRRFADRFTKEQPPGIGADRFIGRQGVVLEEINNQHNTGRVRFDREEWRAESDDDSVIASGTKVEVSGLSGTHVKVKPVQ